MGKSGMKKDDAARAYLYEESLSCTKGCNLRMSQHSHHIVAGMLLALMYYFNSILQVLKLLQQCRGALEVTSCRLC